MPVATAPWVIVDVDGQVLGAVKGAQGAVPRFAGWTRRDDHVQRPVGAEVLMLRVVVGRTGMDGFRVLLNNLKWFDYLKSEQVDPPRVPRADEGLARDWRSTPWTQVETP